MSARQIARHDVCLPGSRDGPIRYRDQPQSDTDDTITPLASRAIGDVPERVPLPGFVIGGYYLSGAQPFAKFKKLIDRALKEAK